MHFCVTIRGRGGAVTLERGAYLGYIRSMYPLPGVAAWARGVSSGLTFVKESRKMTPLKHVRSSRFSFTPARRIYDIAINILETNLRLFGSLAAQMKGMAVT
jgi:hypothetical protein